MKLSFDVKRFSMALLLAMGVVGYVHFFSSLIEAINKSWLFAINPFHLINIDRFLGHFGQNSIAFILGWVGFIGLIAVSYWWLAREKTQ